MVKKKITWIPPVSEFSYAYAKVYRATTQTGVYTELTVSDDPHYTANGILLSSYDYCIDNNGMDTYWYKIRFYDDVNAKYSDYSEPRQAVSFQGYCTVEDVRNYTNIQSAEYSDDAVQFLIDSVTALIDQQTGRTWQGVQTVTDEVLYGDGLPSLVLPRGDIVSVTSVGIDLNNSNVWTTLDASSYYFLTQGVLALYPDSSNIRTAVFPDSSRTRNRNVKVSYTWGKTAPTSDVKMLCILQVAQMVKTDATRYSLISQLTEFLKRKMMGAP